MPLFGSSSGLSHALKAINPICALYPNIEVRRKFLLNEHWYILMKSIFNRKLDVSVITHCSLRGQDATNARWLVLPVLIFPPATCVNTFFGQATRNMLDIFGSFTLRKNANMSIRSHVTWNLTDANEIGWWVVQLKIITDRGVKTTPHNRLSFQSVLNTIDITTCQCIRIFF